jgi:hypothetical protein
MAARDPDQTEDLLRALEAEELADTGETHKSA